MNNLDKIAKKYAVKRSQETASTKSVTKTPMFYGHEEASSNKGSEKDADFVKNFLATVDDAFAHLTEEMWDNWGDPKLINKAMKICRNLHLTLNAKTTSIRANGSILVKNGEGSPYYVVFTTADWLLDALKDGAGEYTYMISQNQVSNDFEFADDVLTTIHGKRSSFNKLARQKSGMIVYAISF